MKVFETRRIIAATAQNVFNAFRDQSVLAKWWGPAGFSNTFNRFEFKPQGRWSFIMHGPDGSRHPNESTFLEIAEPGRIVIRHISEPRFTLTVTIEDVEGCAEITWYQDFENEETARKIAHIAIPANEQNLDRLQALVTVV